MYVAILPTESADKSLAERVATVIGRDLYATRLLLAGRVPKIVAQCESIEAAQSIAQRLKAIGLSVIACLESQLRKSPRSFTAHRVQFGQQGIMFSNKSGQTAMIESVEALLIIAGKVETHESREITKTRMKLNLPATLLTGGIPIRRRITEITTLTDVLTERFIRVYSKKNADSSIEIRQSDFDYSCLSPKPDSSSLVHFSELTTRIKDALPRAVFDDRLTGIFGLCLPHVNPWQNVDMLCELIYLFTAGLPETHLDS